ncbi:diaminopimelate decarboxylase [Desulfofarcimen acetoxidans DSM 771]|uniref:Diaminopimelate decarboxylase n=1 Tax=Desulfofarcimen acetoxidans (strain ATCC 49208 / DSM 771 / KCTC 5769 / VKM B-1644 / 5575) TaxID=485916 RepID=C8VZ05_DESAS|nr:diaminopimelate decarboxylase [Desulfofarcimen acetoxidans]ACV62915.1 diaminopimelate decarboxylase [Desulfofarcimen acetoxidans DSM 771]
MKLHGTMRINESGHLTIGNCDTVDLVREYSTPLYVLDEKYFRSNCREYYRAFSDRFNSDVIYASKTLLNTAVCRMIEEEGLCLDIVSGGELYTALKAGFPASRMYFHGNNKTTDELKLALEAGVGRYIVDNLYELELLNNMAGKANITADILLRITPGVEAHTHEYIKTGQIDSKFGLAIETGQAMEGTKKALNLANVRLHGFHCHIGSQIFELESFAHAANIMMSFINNVRTETAFTAAELDLGGGLGIYYFEGDEPKPVKELADIIINEVRKQADEYCLPVPKIMVEPGRSISGPAGITLYTVGSVKDIPGIRKYVAVDGGMNDNPRPALYQSRYEAALANKMNEKETELVSIAGKCCESGDMLIKDTKLPPAEPGDVLVVTSTGAYNYAMSMNYNRITRPAMILVNEGAAEVIVQRETFEDLIRNDLIPKHLQKKEAVNIAKAE